MPHRKLVRIGETPKLPTISEFLRDMATRQHDEIQRLKSEAMSGTLPDPTVAEKHHEELTPDPWQLHPVRVRKPKKKAASKKSAKTVKRAKVARSAKSKKTAAKPKLKKKTVAKRSRS